MKPVALVPTYDNPRTVRGVVERARAHVLRFCLPALGSPAECGATKGPSHE